jgi:hypothetical protein
VWLQLAHCLDSKFTGPNAVQFLYVGVCQESLKVNTELYGTHISQTIKVSINLSCFLHLLVHIVPLLLTPSLLCFCSHRRDDIQLET